MRESYYLMKYFEYQHLPQKLQEHSKPFYLLALKLDEQWAQLSAREYVQLSRRNEIEVAMRKLLEAKDCAVRAQL